MQPLFIPDTLSTANHDTIRLTVRNTQRVFFPGATGPVIPGYPAYPGDSMPVATLSYTNPTTTNPGILGPTLIWWKGDSVTMAVKNTLMDTTTTHWHGAHVAPQNDGGPHQMIPPDSTWYPSFKIRDEATTMWYHPHLHMMTMQQVQMGMAGMIIIKDAADPLANQLPHTYGSDDIPIILQDKFFQQNKGSVPPSDSINTTCSMGTTFLVNGIWKPWLDAPSQRIRFRFLNGSSERSYCLFIRDSTDHTWVPFSVIASDGGYLDKPYRMGIPPVVPGNLDSLLMIMSGERYEIVFDASQRLGHTLYLMNMRNLMVGNDQILSFAGGPSNANPGCYGTTIDSGGMIPDTNFDKSPLPLMRITCSTPKGTPGTLPASLVPYDIPNGNLAAVTRDKGLYFYNSAIDSACKARKNCPPPFSIDKINFNPQTINDVVYLNDIEKWNITNISGAAHPFHIHDIQFFITSMRNAAGDTVLTLPAYMKGPKDVAPVTDNTRLSLVTQFTDFATMINPDSSYMYHCHILAHEDGGMMHQFVVTRRRVNNVPNPATDLNWNLFPNPTNADLWIELGNTNYTGLKMFDNMGTLVRQWDAAKMSGRNRLRISDLPGGVYLLKLESADGVAVKKVTVLH